MARSEWSVISALACAALAGEAFVGFGLWFSPGWANEWPGGLTIHVVWPAGLTVVVAVMLMTAAVGIGAVVAAGRQSRSGRRVIRLWLATAAVGTAVSSAFVFDSLRADAFEAWPNGYNPRGIALPPADG